MVDNTEANLAGSTQAPKTGNFSEQFMNVLKRIQQDKEFPEPKKTEPKLEQEPKLELEPNLKPIQEPQSENAVNLSPEQKIRQLQNRYYVLQENAFKAGITIPENLQLLPELVHLLAKMPEDSTDLLLVIEERFNSRVLALEKFIKAEKVKLPQIIENSVQSATETIKQFERFLVSTSKNPQEYQKLVSSLPKSTWALYRNLTKLQNSLKGKKPQAIASLYSGKQWRMYEQQIKELALIIKKISSSEEFNLNSLNDFVKIEVDRKLAIYEEKAFIDSYRHKMQREFQQFYNLRNVAKKLTMPVPVELDLPRDLENLMRHALSNRDLDIVDRLLPVIRQRSERLSTLVFTQQELIIDQFKDLLTSGLSGALSNRFVNLQSRVLRLGLEKEAKVILDRFKNDRDFKRLQNLSESTHYTNKKGEVVERQYHWEELNQKIPHWQTSLNNAEAQLNQLIQERGINENDLDKQAAELAKKYREITPALKLKDEQVQDSLLPEFARYLKGYLFEPSSRDVVTNWQNQKNSQNVLPKLQEFGVSLERAQTVINNLQKTTLPELAKSLQEKVNGYSLSKAELETVLPDKQIDLKKQRIFEQMVLSLLQLED